MSKLPDLSREGEKPRRLPKSFIPKGRKLRKELLAKAYSAVLALIAIVGLVQLPFPLSIVGIAVMVIICATVLTWSRSTNGKWLPSPFLQHALLMGAVTVGALEIAFNGLILGEKISESWAALSCSLLYSSSLWLAVARAVPNLTVPLRSARWSNRALWSRAILGAAGLLFAWTLVSLVMSRSVGSASSIDEVLSLLSEAFGIAVVSFALFSGRDGTVTVVSIAAGIVTVSLGLASVQSGLLAYGFEVMGFGLWLSILGPAIRSRKRLLIRVASYCAGSVSLVLGFQAHQVNLRLIGYGYFAVGFALLVFGALHHGRSDDHLVVISEPRPWLVSRLLSSAALLAGASTCAFVYAFQLWEAKHFASATVFAGVGTSIATVIIGYAFGYFRQRKASRLVQLAALEVSSPFLS